MNKRVVRLSGVGWHGSGRCSATFGCDSAFLVSGSRYVRGNADLRHGRSDGSVGVVVDVNLEALDGLGGIETLRADASAVHDGVALVDLQLVLSQELETFIANGIAAVVDPAEGLQENGGTEVLLFGTPPVRRARSRAARAQDALVEAIQILALLICLHHLLTVHQMIHTRLQPGADRLVLGVEVAHVGHEVSHNGHVRQRVDSHATVLIYTLSTSSMRSKREREEVSGSEGGTHVRGQRQWREWEPQWREWE